MSWIGKLVGGGIGLVFGGPLGAMLGASLGHAADVKIEEERNAARDYGQGAQSRPRAGFGGGFTRQEQMQTVFFTSVFAMMGKLAKADGVVSREEIKVVERFMQQHLKLDPRARNLAINIFNRAKSDPYPFSRYADEFAMHFRHDPNMRRFLFQMLFEMAGADGGLHEQEDALLRDAAGRLGLEYAFYESLKARFTPSLHPAYAILGLEGDASEQDVKKAYRAKVMEYHPDKIVSKGLPEEFLKLAEEKFKEVNQAYEDIKKLRGWK